MTKFCPPSAPPDCAPGCSDADGNPNWCAHEDAWAIDPSSQVWNCAFRPEDLEAMLRHHLDSRAQEYNEVVVDAARWVPFLPDSLLAFFFLVTEYGGEGERKARDAHRRFHERYPGASTPIVSLDVHGAPGQAWRLVQE